MSTPLAEQTAKPGKTLLLSDKLFYAGVQTFLLFLLVKLFFGCFRFLLCNFCFLHIGYNSVLLGGKAPQQWHVTVQASSIQQSCHIVTGQSFPTGLLGSSRHRERIRRCAWALQAKLWEATSWSHVPCTAIAMYVQRCLPSQVVVIGVCKLVSWPRVCRLVGNKELASWRALLLLKELGEVKAI